MSTVELNTLACKKWENNYGGTHPELDISDGILVGDFAIDTSSSPHNIWKCFDNTEGNPVWIIDKPASPKTAITTITLDEDRAYQPASNGDTAVVALEGDHVLTLTSPADATVPISVFIETVQDGVGGHEHEWAGQISTPGAELPIVSTGAGAIHLWHWKWTGAAYRLVSVTFAPTWIEAEAVFVKKDPGNSNFRFKDGLTLQVLNPGTSLMHTVQIQVVDGVASLVVDQNGESL